MPELGSSFSSTANSSTPQEPDSDNDSTATLDGVKNGDTHNLLSYSMTDARSVVKNITKRKHNKYLYYTIKNHENHET